MNVSLTYSLYHFRSISRQCRIYLLYHSQNWFCMIICQFSIHCQFEGLVEMRYVWKDPTSKILFSFNTFSKSFVTHSLKTSIISNTSCTSYACSFSTYRWVSYDLFVLIFVLVGLIFSRQGEMGAVFGKN